MSKRNGERARFQINRKRKLRHRQRLRTLLKAVRKVREGAPENPPEPGDRTAPI